MTNENSKLDAERAAFEDWADSQWPGAKRQQLKCDNYGEYLNCIYRDMWRGWKARASLPVGVPDPSELQRVIYSADSAAKRMLDPDSFWWSEIATIRVEFERFMRALLSRNGNGGA